MNASSVATMALSLLERSVMGALVKGGTPWTSRNAFIIRISRDQQPTRVSLKWDESHQFALVLEVGVEKSAEFKDTPTDCPEYVSLNS